MATWLLRNPSRLEILHLIQQHNRINPAPGQQISLHLSSDEDFKLRNLEQEQKFRKRNFNTVQRSAYSLRRCIEEVLSYNATTSTATYDREICVAATRDFLAKLEAEIEALESLKMAVERVKILEDEEVKAERKTDEWGKTGSAKENEDENKPSAKAEPQRKVKEASICKALVGEKSLKSKNAIVVKVSRRKWDDRLWTMAADQKTLRRYNSSETQSGTDTTTSIFELHMPDLTEENSVQPGLIHKLSQDMPEILEQPKSAANSLSKDQKSIMSSPLELGKTIKGILKVRPSVEDLVQSSEQTNSNASDSLLHSPEPPKRKLHPVHDHEAFGIERDRQMAKSLRKAHERGLELYSEVKRFKWDGSESEMEV